MPPATAASNLSWRFFFSARSASALPWVASRALLAVTTCLPLSSAASISFLAMPSSPPINSTTTSASLLTRDMGSAAKFSTLKPRALPGLRALTPTIARLRPARALRSAAWAESALTTPPPTVPSLFGRGQIDGRMIGAHGKKFLHIARRLTDAMLILHQRHAHIAFAIFAEADPGRDRDLGMLEQRLGEFHRAGFAEFLRQG